MFAGCYESGVLDEDVHGQLISRLPDILMWAGIGGYPEAVWTPMSEFCSEKEVDWVTNLRSHGGVGGKFGFYYDLDQVKNADERMVALTGCLIRNFVNVRMMPLNQALSDQKELDEEDPQVLIIPNFFNKGEARDLHPMRRTAIHDLLSVRIMINAQTILGVQEPNSVRQLYGTQIADIIKHKYTGIVK